MSHAKASAMLHLIGRTLGTQEHGGRLLTDEWRTIEKYLMEFPFPCYVITSRDGFALAVFPIGQIEPVQGKLLLLVKHNQFPLPEKDEDAIENPTVLESLTRILELPHNRELKKVLDKLKKDALRR